MNILFLARALECGGAERQLALLAKRLAANGHTVTVLVFYSGGIFYEDVLRSGVPVLSLNKRGRWDIFGFGVRLLRLVRARRADVVHSYLTVPNLLTALLKPLLPPCRVVWGMRASNVEWTQYDWVSRCVDRIERHLARYADLIIVNSQAGYAHAGRRGFPREKMIVIPNGVDVDQFRPDRSGGEQLRRRWGVRDDEYLIGLVGRIDPMKDHATFIRAAALLAARRSDVRFICIGDGAALYKQSLMTMAQGLGLGQRLHWEPSQADMRPVYNALDILSSTSAWGEGFPNVVAEAMACGVRCVVTNVGDSAVIVNGYGIVAPPGDPASIVEAWMRLMDNRQSVYPAWPQMARTHIEQQFSTERMVQRTVSALQAISQ